MAQNTLMVVYSEDSTDNVVYRKTSLSNISFGPKQMFIQGTLNTNNSSTTKQVLDADAVVVAANESHLMYGVHITWPASSIAALTTVSSTQSQSGSLSPSTVTGDLLFSSTEIL